MSSYYIRRTIWGGGGYIVDGALAVERWTREDMLNCKVIGLTVKA